MTPRKKRRVAYKRPQHKWVRQSQPIKFEELIKSIVDDFFKQHPSVRLRLLAADLAKNAGTKRGRVLANNLQRVADAFENIDRDWGAHGLSNSIRYFIDTHIERMLPRYLTVMLYQLNAEAMLTNTQSPIDYQEHMRLAAGLQQQISKSTEALITDIYLNLISADRKKGNKISPGGKVSPLKQYSHALCFHYERLHPIWRTVKSTYKKFDDRKMARKMILNRFSDLGKGERWSINKDRIGLPSELLDRAESEDPYESSAEYLAYRHAALMCGFGVGTYTVKQIKRVVADHKKMMGAGYYNSTFRTKSVIRNRK